MYGIEPGPESFWIVIIDNLCTRKEPELNTPPLFLIRRLDSLTRSYQSLQSDIFFIFSYNVVQTSYTFDSTYRKFSVSFRHKTAVTFKLRLICSFVILTILVTPDIHHNIRISAARTPLSFAILVAQQPDTSTTGMIDL